MNEDEKTALEIIYSLPQIIKKLESKIDVIDGNVKLLNNKLKSLKENIEQKQPKEGITSTTNNQNINQPKINEARLPRAEAPIPHSIPEVSQKPQKQNTETTKLVIGNKKVFGYIKTTSMKPVFGASVKVFDIENNLVKDISSDKDGYWECRLPKGKFNCEILMGTMKLINRNFELNDEIKELEIK